MRNLLIGFIFGAGLGSGITYYIMKKKMESREEEIRKDARAEYKEYYERKQEEEDAAKIVHIKKIPDKPTKEEKKYVELTREYDRAESERPTEEDLIEETENLEKMHDALDNAHEQPKLIKIDNFGEIQSYNTESLTYYVEDQTLVHEDDTVVDDETFLLGDALDRYGWRDDDEDQDPLYVRNYKIQRDFEVIKVFAEYNPEG